MTLQRLEEVLLLLKTDELKRVLWYARWRRIVFYFRIAPPIGFSLRASILMLVLLTIMPFHPMVIPTIIGGGISLALLFQI